MGVGVPVVLEQLWVWLPCTCNRFEERRQLRVHILIQVQREYPVVTVLKYANVPRLVQHVKNLSMHRLVRCLLGLHNNITPFIHRPLGYHLLLDVVVKCIE